MFHNYSAQTLCKYMVHELQSIHNQHIRSVQNNTFGFYFKILFEIEYMSKLNLYSSRMLKRKYVVVFINSQT